MENSMWGDLRNAGLRILGAILVLFVIYLLSFGPACWWITDAEPGGCVSVYYWPIGFAVRDSLHEVFGARGRPGMLYRVVAWYAMVGRNSHVFLPVDSSGNELIIVSGKK